MASYINLMPIMTMNTQSYQGNTITLTADSSGAGTEPYRAFNGVTSNVQYSEFSANSTTFPHWLRIDFGVGKKVNKYTMVGSTGWTTGVTTASPKNWTFEGSNDAVSWTVLDTQTNITGWVLGEKREFIIDNQKLYRYYQIKVTSHNGYSTNIMTIGEMELFEFVSINKILISSSGGLNSVTPKSYTPSLIPILTSNTSASPIVVSASLQATTGYEAYKAFDGSQTTNWYPTGSATGTTSGWLKVDFGKQYKIAKYTVFCSETTQSPKDWDFEGSNTGLFSGEQTLLDSRTNQAYSTTKIECVISNPSSFRYYRLNIKSTNGTTYLRINEVEIMEEIPPSIKNIPSSSEQNFINHGIDKSIELNLLAEMSQKLFIEQSPTTLGSGKVFKKSIDTAQVTIKKVSIE